MGKAQAYCQLSQLEVNVGAYFGILQRLKGGLRLKRALTNGS